MNPMQHGIADDKIELAKDSRTPDGKKSSGLLSGAQIVTKVKSVISPSMEPVEAPHNLGSDRLHKWMRRLKDT